MSLPSGTKLGPYEVLAPLGAGGMGEVFRARDTRLGRDVAVKVLPDELSNDRKALARFESEARAVAALSHPNILFILDVGEVNGVHYAVTELLEGETLRALVTRGALPVRRALEIAQQLAEGLAAAHQKGIVHRDVKPENVFLTKDGHAKLLDFGLARQAPGLGPGGDTRSPTEAALTETGAVVGTVSYMSPEQARGLPADFRSDQFSLGVVLYEMLAGRRPFTRASPAEMMTAIIREEPEPLETKPGAVPVPVRWLVERCLGKGPEERYASTEDLARELATLRLHLSDASSGMAVAAGPAVPEPGKRVRAVLLLALAAVLAGAALFVAGSFLGRRKAGASAPRYQQITFLRGTVRQARFAPDGHTVVYSASWQGQPSEVYSVRLDGPESRPLGFPRAEFLAISPTSELALALDAHPGAMAQRIGTLARVPFSGGTPRPLLEEVAFADFSPDGSELAVVREAAGRASLEYPVGKVLYRPAQGWLSDPRVSPDGELVAFAEHPVGTDYGGLVAVVDREGRRRALTGRFLTVMGLAWARAGEEVWFGGERPGSNVALWAATLDGRERVVLSQATSLVLHDVARDGQVLATTVEFRGRSFFRAAADASDRELSWMGFSMVTDLSPDGRKVVLQESGAGVGSAYQLCVRETSGEPPLKLGPGRHGTFSADGRFVVTPAMDVDTIVVYPLGPGATRTIDLPGFSVYSAGLMPDGKTVWFQGSEPSKGRRVWIIDDSAAKPRAVTPELSGGVYYVRRDGAYALGASGGAVRLYPLSGGEPVPIAGLAPDEAVAGWSEDGESVFACRYGETPARVFRVRLRTGERELVHEITPAERSGILNGGPVRIGVAADGKSYEFSTISWLTDLHVVQGPR